MLITLPSHTFYLQIIELSSNQVLYHATLLPTDLPPYESTFSWLDNNRFIYNSPSAVYLVQLQN